MATVKIDQTTTYHEPYASGEFGSVYLDWAIPRQPLLVGFRKTTKRKFSVKVRIILCPATPEGSHRDVLQSFQHGV